MVSKYRPVIFRTTKDWIRIVFKWFVEQLEHCQERRDEKFFPTFSTDSWSGKNVNKGVRRERERGRQREREEEEERFLERETTTNQQQHSKQTAKTHTHSTKKINLSHTLEKIYRKTNTVLIILLISNI